MFKKLTLLVVLSAFLFVDVAVAQKADDIVKKVIEARGGKNALKNLKSYTIKGKIKAKGMEIGFTYYYKSPDKYRQESEMMGMKQVIATDGKDVWQSAMGQTRKIEGEQAKQAKLNLSQLSSMLEGPFENYPSKDIKIEFAGKVKEDGRDAYTLKATDTAGNVSYLYVDRNNYELFKLFAQANNGGQITDITMNIKDYKKAGKANLPRAFVINMGNQKIEYILDKIDIDSKLDDKLFKYPK